MDIRHLRYFLAVAETLNFTAAAKRLGIAQPPLSVQIKQLESEIGQPLFHRSSRKVTLTEAGKILCREAVAVIEQSNHLTAVMQDLREGRGAGLEIEVASYAADPWLARQLRKFMKKNRGIRCRVRFFDQPIDLKNCQADVVILDRSEAEDWTQLALATKAVYVALPRKHRLADREEIDVMDLIGEHLLISPPSEYHIAEKLILKKYPDLLSRLSSEVIVGNPAQRIWKAEAGFGITICGEMEIESAKATAVKVSSDVAILNPVLAYRSTVSHPGIEALLVHLNASLQQ